MFAYITKYVIIIVLTWDKTSSLGVASMRQSSLFSVGPGEIWRYAVNYSSLKQLSKIKIAASYRSFKKVYDYEKFRLSRSLNRLVYSNP